MASKGLLMADHSKPTNDSLYNNYTAEIDARFDDLAQGLDPAVTTATNVRINTIRWNSANSYWEKYNGTIWAALDTGYEIDLAGARKILTNSASPALTITQTGAGDAFVVEDAASDGTPFVIDNDGNLIAGLTTNNTVASSRYLYQAASNTKLGLSSIYYNANTIGTAISLAKSKSSSTGTNALVGANDILGTVNFAGADGTDFVNGASISAAVDSTPGTNDMPGRLVFSTTADGASAPAERMRIDSNGQSLITGYLRSTTDIRAVQCLMQATSPVNSNVSATLAASTLTSGIATGTPAAAISFTLPTGTNMDAVFQTLQTNQTFEWSVINLAAATHAITVLANTAHTVVGNMIVAANTSGRFATRKTAANTFITYRLG